MKNQKRISEVMWLHPTADGSHFFEGMKSIKVILPFHSFQNAIFTPYLLSHSALSETHSFQGK